VKLFRRRPDEAALQAAIARHPAGRARRTPPPPLRVRRPLSVVTARSAHRTPGTGT